MFVKGEKGFILRAALSGDIPMTVMPANGENGGLPSVNMIIVPGVTKADVIVRLKSIMKEDEDKGKVKKARYALRHQDRWEIYNVVMFL